MSCSCSNTTTKTYTIERTTNGYRILDGRTVATSCGGTLNVVPPGGYDCIRLVFNYDSDSDELLPILATGNCPCEADTNHTTGQQFIARFQIPRGEATCSYLWTLTQSQPPCRIDIVIHAP